MRRSLESDFRAIQCNALLGFRWVAFPASPQFITSDSPRFYRSLLLLFFNVFIFNWFHNIVFKRLDDLSKGIIN